MARRNKSWKANDVEEKACNLHKRMKKKAKVNIVKKKTSHAFITSGAKHDSLAWFFGNKIYIWGKIKICIYFFLLEGLWKECFLMSWRKICHRSEKNFNLLQTFKGEMKEAQRGSKFKVEFSFVCQNVVFVFLHFHFPPLGKT